MSTTRIVGLDPQTGRSIAITVEDGIVARIEDASDPAEFYLAPGFVDLQVNGYAGFDLNAEQISTQTVVGLVDAMLSNGVTCFAPTLITAPEEAICDRLKVIAEARKLYAKVAACVPFVHVEGPHISPLDGYRGAHPANSVRPPSIAEFNRWQQAAGGIVGMVTLSPHFDKSVEYIVALAERGVHVAIGHTHASPEQIAQAINAGASLSTHLGNGIAQKISRHPNPIWSQLSDDRLTASFIADGQHLPPEVLKAMLRAKGVTRSILVSDSVALAGMQPGVYKTPVGGEVELRPNGRLCVLGTEMLAGSTASLAQCIGNLVRVTQMPLNDALALVTINPGRYAGGRGKLTRGSRADLIRFRWSDELVIEDVWLAGEHVRGSLESGEARIVGLSSIQEHDVQTYSPPNFAGVRRHSEAARLIGAVDIGGTKIAVGAVREDGTVIHRSECPTDPSKGFSHAMQRIHQMLHEAANTCGAFEGIGIACPGPLDPLSGIIGDVGTLPGWAGGNLVRELQEDFGVTVAVENDADAAALAEYRWGAAQGAGNFIFITVSTGIGGGIVLGGQIYRGVDGAHPELGHQIIDSLGPQCYCGAHGCWESLASGTAMSAWMSEQTSAFSSIPAAEICALATQGNELALQAVRREGRYLGLGLANLVTLFTPDMIALGGGVMKSNALFLDDARNVVRELCTQVPMEKTRIVLSSLGSEAGLLGAARAWFSRHSKHS